MDDKVLIAIIAASSSLAGVLMSAILSFLLAARAEKQKATFSSGEYLQTKLRMLEEAKLKLLSQDAVEKDIEEDPHAAIAAALMSVFASCHRTVQTIGHYLPPSTTRDLLAQEKSISDEIATARAIHFKVNADKDRKTPESRVPDMYTYIDAVKVAIDAEMQLTVVNLERIYQIGESTAN